MLSLGLLLLSFAICGQGATYLNTTFTGTDDPSTSQITSTQSSNSISCSVGCSVDAQMPSAYGWQPYYINETITAATLVVIVNTRYNYTTTSVQLASLPSGYTLPEINDKGTHVTTVTYPRGEKSVTTVVAFPTGFMWWPDGYTWSGQLQSSVQGQHRNECVQATTSSYVPFTTFPQPEVHMPTHSMGPDPEGWMFKPTVDMGLLEWYVGVYTDEPAWQQCSRGLDVAPIVAIFTARFMTATVTSFDDTKPPETAKPVDRVKSPGASETPAANSKPPEDTPSEEPKFSPFAASEEGPKPTAAEPPGNSGVPQPGAFNKQPPAETNYPNPGQSNVKQPPPASGKPEGKYQPQTAAEQLVPVGSETLRLTADESTTALILPNGKTLEPGSTYTADGTPIYLPTSGPGSEIVVGEATVTFHPTAPSAAQFLTIGSNTIPVSFADLSSEGIVLANGITLHPGQATTIDGTLISLAPSGTALVVDGTTVPLSNLSLPTPPAFATAPNGGVILPNGQTLLPGSQTILDGTTFSVDSSGALIVADESTTKTIEPSTAYATASNGGVILPNGQTLLPGSKTTIDGTTFSVDPSGTLVVADQSTTKTIGLKTTRPESSARRTGTASETETSSAAWRANGTMSATSTTSKGAGAYIWQGLGGNKAPAKGEASGRQPIFLLWLALEMLIGGAAVLL